MSKNNLRKISLIILIIMFMLGTINSFSYAGVSDTKLNEAVDNTAKYMYETVVNPQVGSIGGEWAIIGLARSGYKIPDSYYQKYYLNVEEYVKSLNGNLHSVKYTEYSRVIVALSSIGIDARDVGGYDLTKALGDYDKTIYQGLNGPIWALIALDSLDYPMPVNKDAKVQASRDMYINRILECQLADGGWSLFGGTKAAGPNEKSDPDITGMALQALAKYQDKPAVKKASDEAIEALSKMQNDKGGFSSWGTENSESCVQVIVALNELGISLEDERFIKNGNSLLDNLLSYYKKDKGFLHTKDGSGSNQMASEQGLYGIVSAKRAIEDKSSLYRMDDSKVVSKTDSKVVSKGLEGKSKDIKTMPIVNHGITFSDITGVNAHKNQVAIEALASRNIINGKSKDKFDPNSTMTRAEFATIIVKSLGITPKGEKVFKDVNNSDWFYEYVSTANKYGIIKGKSKDEFNPNGLITKEEAATMLKRASNLAGLSMKLDTMGIRDILAQFGDYVKISDWAMESVAYCYQNKILDMQDLEVNPKKNVTRSEIAQMVFNMLNVTNLL